MNVNITVDPEVSMWANDANVALVLWLVTAMENKDTAASHR